MEFGARDHADFQDSGSPRQRLLDAERRNERYRSPTKGLFMPDRFDLMDRHELLSSLRISSDWCGLVNRTGLNRTDVARLAAGSAWIEAMTEDLQRILRSDTTIGATSFDSAPTLDDDAGETETVIDRFLVANNRARLVVASIGHADWRKSVPYPDGRRTSSIEDLARHLTRVSQLSSVDQRWIW